jgi:hypothetical protein
MVGKPIISNGTDEKEIDLSEIFNSAVVRGWVGLRLVPILHLYRRFDLQGLYVFSPVVKIKVIRQ